MCRTIVGVSANPRPVDPEGKNLHSSVSSQFAEGTSSRWTSNGHSDGRPFLFG